MGIKPGDGLTISPHEIEFAFYEHPAVLEAGVVGLPHPIWGQTLKAFIALKKNVHSITKKNLFDHINKYFKKEKALNDIIILPQLPKGAIGKIDRRLIRELTIEQQL